MWQLQFCRGLFYALLAAGRVAQIASTGEGAAQAAAEAAEAEAAARGAERFLLPLFGFAPLSISVMKMQREHATLEDRGVRQKQNVITVSDMYQINFIDD
jgi:hypothetical protein